MGSIETTRHWPRRIECPEDVPPTFEQELADSARASVDVVYAPAPGSLFSAQKEHLVVSDDETLTIHAAQGGKRSFLSSPLREIELLEWGSVLLHSWVKICAGGDSVTIHFNSVGEGLFRPLIARIRRASWPGEDERTLQTDNAAAGSNAGSAASSSAGTAVRPNDEAEKLRCLRTRAFKFVNYGSRCLIPGEPIASTLFQELFSARALRGGRFMPLSWYVSPHLFILTGKELIFLREEQELALLKRYAYQYGCVRTFLASQRIADVHVDEHDGFQELAVRTTKGQTIRSRFARDNPELPNFLQAVHETACKKDVSGSYPR